MCQSAANRAGAAAMAAFSHSAQAGSLLCGGQASRPSTSARRSIAAQVRAFLFLTAPQVERACRSTPAAARLAPTQLAGYSNEMRRVPEGKASASKEYAR